MANLIRRTEPQAEVMPSTWEPFRLMRDLMNWDPFAEMFPTVNRFEGATFTPRFEVKETKDAYVFKGDLPGIEEKDLDITLTGNRLTLSGRREAEQKQESDTYYAFERSYGSFTRSFTMPEGIDTKSVAADLKEGVLTITITKTPESQPKSIPISTKK